MEIKLCDALLVGNLCLPEIKQNLVRNATPSIPRPARPRSRLPRGYTSSGQTSTAKLKRLLSPFFSAGEEWVDHAPCRAGRMRWPHISAATKRARYSGALVRACVRNGKAIFLCVVLRFQLGLFSSVTFFVRVFPTMRSLHSAGKFVATEINTLLNASESLLIFSLSLPLAHSLSHSHLSSPSDLLTCADKLCG